MPAHAALGDDCARFELRENIVTHLKAIPCPLAPSEPWPAPSDADGALAAPQLSPVALGDPVALEEAAQGLASAWRALGQACAAPPAAPEPWLAPLCQPADAALQGGEAARVADLLLLAAPGMAPTQRAAFALLRSLPFFDRGLAAACFPACRTLYELEVARQVLRRLGARVSLDQCRLELSGWRRRGLYYPLLVAASHLPAPEQWLAPDLAQETPARGLAALLAALASPDPALDLDAAVSDFARSQAPDLPSSRHIAHALDRLAAAMGVKSDAAHRDGHALDRCLASLPAGLHDPVDIWARAKTDLERVLPPSALLAPARGRPAWCAPRLRLEFLRSERRLRFAPCTLAVPTLATTTSATTTSPPTWPGLRRLQDAVQRIGALCLRPDLAHAMVCPAASRDATARGLPLPPHLARACRDPASLLAAMANPASVLMADPDEARRYLRDARATHAPSRSTALKHTQHLLAWRVEGPRRVVLFTGTHAEASSDPAATPPHLLTKTLLPVPSRRPELAEVRLATAGPPPSEADIRARLLHTARTALDGAAFVERTAASGRRTGAIAHALEEAALAFSRPPPAACHARIPLGRTQHWDKDHIDTRYAETQAAPNGFRLRDWACAYADGADVEKSRLEAHAVAFDALHHTVVPWLRRDGTTVWLQARSTVPFPPGVLPHPLSDPAGSRSPTPRALHEAVKALYAQDTAVLPAPAGAPPPDRADTATYLDEAQGHVLVVYTLAGRLEFASFAPAPL